MKFENNKNLPITNQIYEQVCLMIIQDKLEPNTKISSVRDFAIELGVNPNTVQKSYELLEISKVIYSIRGSGWYISEDASIASEIVKNIIKKKVDNFLDEMYKLGVSQKEVLTFIKERKD